MTDYISREAAVLSLLDKGQHSRRYKLGEIWELDFEEIREAINSIPAANIAPVVKAKWELDSDKLPICSNCGEIALQRIFVKVPHLIQDVRMVKSNFCPNCGAAMMEES